MPREKPLHVTVENESDDALCPECNEKMRKEDPPHRSMPDLPKPGEWLAGAMGKAFCVNADCPVCEEQNFVSWSYRTGGLTYRVTSIPAACEGEVFQNSPPDEEPDGEVES